MRMFQSVWGHSSEQSTAYFCSRPTVSQFKLIWESPPNTKDTNFHRHTIAPFRSKLESNGLQTDHNRKFSERIFFNSCNIQGNIQVFRFTGLLYIFISIVKYKVQRYIILKVSIT